MQLDDRALLAQGIERLADLLGPAFEVAPIRDQTSVPGEADLVYGVRALSPGASYAPIVVQARGSLTPAEATTVLLPQIRLLRQVSRETTILVVAPWLSPRTRGILLDHQVGYLDLTGNVDLRLPTGVLIRTEGARRVTPRSEPQRRSRGLAGASAGVVTRLLVDFCPPFRQRDLARVGRVSPGYLSRLMRTLDDEALIHRDGPSIVDVRWAELLRARATSYDLTRINHITPTVFRRGPEALHRNLVERGSKVELAVTGTYAAREVVSISVGGPLMIYTAPGIDDRESIADALELMPSAGGGANVLLLRPPNRGPFDRMRTVGAIRHVGLSQLVADCLSGPGRLPAEGEALLSRMVETEAFGQWRRAPGELSRAAAALT